MDATLLSILPTYTAGALPSALTSLAAALLAQSRSKASTLKPEEEAARTYTCCHLACERLKQRLNLPKIEPRPPCGPKVYKKLYTYLDNVLSAKATPARATLDAPIKGPGSAKTLQDSSPSVARGVSTRKRSGDTALATERPKLVAHRSLPDWLSPTLRHLCRVLGASDSYPHVYTGILSVTQDDLTEPSQPRIKRRAGDLQRAQASDLHEPDWPALIIAILLLVLPNTLDISDPSEYLDSAIQELVSLERIDAGKSVDVQKNIEKLLEEEGPKWQDMEWFRTAAHLENDDGDPDAMNMSNDHSSTGVRYVENQLRDLESTFSSSQRILNYIPNDKGFLQTGLGTMMQEKIDWLSAERQMDFIRWKAFIIKKIEEIESLNKAE